MSLTYVGNKELMTVLVGSNYTAGDPTLTLQTGQGALLPATGTFWIRQATLLQSTLINILKVTARTGDVLTVVGGQDGTIDQSIPAGTLMCWVLGDSALTQLKADIAASGDNVVGTVYQPTSRTAAVASTNLLTSAPAGLYRVSAYVQTTSTNATPLFLSVVITWVFNGITNTMNIVNSLNLGTANSYAGGVDAIRVDAGSTVSFEITAAAGSYAYLHMVVLSKLG